MDDQTDSADDIKEPTDDDLKQTHDDLDLIDPVDKKHEDSEPPSVKGEEDVFSGDAPESGEAYDIDEELEKVGLEGDANNKTPDPLGVQNELDEEVE